MPPIIPLNLTLSHILGRIQRKYPNATIDAQRISAHMGEFRVLECYFNMTRVAIRAITYPQDENGKESCASGEVHYHWACFCGVSPNLQVYIIHYKPSGNNVQQKKKNNENLAVRK
ncbi:uncharacterized protein CELE_C03B1.3 [Caenorhabditis elegans]|uniref:Uncharacterized protein C03B1.3 n=1 Tax=Caenorhabditis elegans TaxID=6239 RepID=YX03_CAEEL|nr:Uncharacterized protein CELE_C03B1.3 [Caenorhabditis elegans]Q11110.1 RecName: Full=Uncharacterized protein C03B1.3 [Caenorhabditis elegans]CCD62739.1 Uncharacterized protein CELE_C03B1.3 [Caenorhabditis elegans]|eukprot:NP_509069.1 Uncharacterized protein CELE_C03B1.3 [Caenorhabditis elegans]